MGDDVKWYEEKYYYDPEAAEKPIRFIEKFLVHPEGQTAGQPFKLLEWQKERVIRPMFGWLRKDNHRRRFQELFLMTAKGAGKTPMLSAIGLWCLLSDGEKSPHVISMASSFEQANYTFEFAKKYIANNKALARHCDPKQYQIKAAEWGKPDGKFDGKWTLISGKPTGRSGSRPSCCIADEAHEWEAPTAQSYNLVSANLFKRAQPLLLVATNAPSSSTSFAYRLYERAKKVLEGTSEDETLLPVIYEASKDLDWTSEAAARAANPSIPAIVTFEQLKPRLSKAKETPIDEGEYRRLYLSQQTQKGTNWLDIDLWDSNCADIDPETIKGCPLYVGMDLSQGDDLCAVTYIYATAKGFSIDSHFWLPKSTAEYYEEHDGIPYKKWAEAGAITLLDEPTISEKAKLEIAQHILAKKLTHKIKAVCYDRYDADECIAALEAVGIVCVPIPQGWGVSRGCVELDRRLKEHSISISNNPVLRAQAEIVEINDTDSKYGNIYPEKPNAKGKYAGKRSAKIDGISALVTGLTEARKHNFAKAATPAKAWII